MVMDIDRTRITEAYERRSRARREAEGTSSSVNLDDEGMLVALRGGARALEDLELRLLLAALPVQVEQSELALLDAVPAFRSVLRQLAFAEMAVSEDDPGEYVELVLGGALHEECPTMCMCLRSLAQSCVVNAGMLQDLIDYEHEGVAEQAVRDALSSARGMSGRLIRLGHALAQRTQIPARRRLKPLMRDRSSEVVALSLSSEALEAGRVFLEGLSFQAAFDPDRWEDDVSASTQPLTTSQPD